MRGADCRAVVGRLAVVLGLIMALGACAATQEEPDDEMALLGYEPPKDPIEPVNRKIHAFNMVADKYVLKPVAQGYDEIPIEFRNIVRNFVRHVSSPVVLANDLLQGDLTRAGNTSARMFINTFTLGLGDLAGDRYPYHVEDFGQTLGTYGSDEQFYLVLPLLGPSSGRDVAGMIVDIFLDPLFYVEPGWTTYYGISSTVNTGIDQRARNLGVIEDLRKDSVDFYARLRSLYLQRRRAQIENDTEDLPAGPGFAGDEGNSAQAEN